MSLPKIDSALQDAIDRIQLICAASQGKSQCFPYGGSGYKGSVTHFFESSTKVAAFAVQPGSIEDLAKIIEAIADTGVQFGIKCGGHSTNPGFSSTTGIQIYLVRLNHVILDQPNKLVRVGAGCLFEELYLALAPHNLNIVGGTGISGVGVAGWMLGGGYSVKTSRLGLGIDNLEAVKVVLPDGSIKVASGTENKDLFWAIKGGGNNYGVVGEFTLKAHDQPPDSFYDRIFVYRTDFDLVKEAIYKIIQKQDNRANIEAKFRHFSQFDEGPLATLEVHCVYDGILPNPSPFGELEKIPHDDKGLWSRETGSFLFADLRRSYFNGTYDLLSTIPTDSGDDLPEPPMVGIGQFPRGRWGNVMTDEFTPAIVNAIEEQSRIAAEGLKDPNNGGTRITIGLWPFTKTMFDNAIDSAFPHEQGKPNCPIIAYFTWEKKKNDEYWVGVMEKTLSALRKKVFEERPEFVKDLPYMINTALVETTTVKELYRGNLKKLEGLRQDYDPHGVMDHTGGFKIPRA